MDTILLTTAAGIGIIHTAIGIDHYLPFAALGKANSWSFAKTMFIVFICGIGHVAASVVLGLLGIWFGARLSFLVGIESFRGEVAGWFLLAFGMAYTLWGIRRAIKNKPHRHISVDGREIWHDHKNTPANDGHGENIVKSNSFWSLFILLVLGPCEPLIPLLMYPAAETDMLSVALVALVFSVCTIATMLVCTGIALKGFDLIPMTKIERYSHVLAGLVILICGVGLQLFDI